MSHKQIALSDGHNNPRSKRDWCSTSPDLFALSTRDEVPVPTNDINFCTGQNRKSRLEELEEENCRLKREKEDMMRDLNFSRCLCEALQTKLIQLLKGQSIQKGCSRLALDQRFIRSLPCCQKQEPPIGSDY